MLRLIILSSVLLCLSSLAEQRPLPEPLAHLEQYKDDADAFVAALREYDKTQQSAALALMEEGDKLRAEGKTAEAQAAYERAMETMKPVVEGYNIALNRYSDNAKLHSYYGELLYDVMQNQTQAVVEWHKALSLDNSISGAHNNLGLHYSHIGKYELGFKHMEEALRLEKNNPDYLFNLAQMYLIYFPQVQKMKGWKPKRTYKEAMKLSEKAAQLAPDDFLLQHDHAMNFFAAENFEQEADWQQAAAAWQRARTLARTDAERFNAWLNEARVWIKLEDHAKTIECLNAALAIDSGSVIAQELLKEAQARLQP